MRVYAVYSFHEDTAPISSNDVGVFLDKSQAEDYALFVESTDATVEWMEVVEYEVTEDWKIGAWRDSEEFYNGRDAE
jgi:hypothetical protein